MAGVHIFEAAELVQNAVEDGGVAIFSAALAEILIHARKNAGERNVHGRGSEKYALQQRSQQRRGNALTGNVADEEAVTATAQFNHVETIAADGMARERRTGH